MQSDTAVKSCVARMVHDIRRRNSNVIIVGFPEQDHVNDGDAFAAFCESNLEIKPAMIECKRLGRISPDGSPPETQAPRRLFVRLRSAQVATDLIRVSRSLRRSYDPNMRRIYVNPDLKSEQAKLAHEYRNVVQLQQLNNQMFSVTTMHAAFSRPVTLS